MDRYLVLAEEQSLPALIVLNKLDLLLAKRKLDEEFYERTMEKAEYYRKWAMRFLLFSNLS